MEKYKITLRKWTSILLILVMCIPISVQAKAPSFVEFNKAQYGEDTMHEYRHVQSGLKVVWIENQDINKSFALGVKTPTSDSTGVNHIIEHTLFTGSKHFPSSTLFFDASSTYPNTFMNAMTSSDMTYFPFSTPYDDAFNGLLKVYLDSILNPNMLEQHYSFYEESFHYNPYTKQYGGVVYNEMKGASNDLNRQIFRAIRQSLYVGTHYTNDSGGDPKEIPTLTYEQFIRTYKKYYFPGNMMIVLYGQLPIEETLKAIDTYFENLPLSDVQIQINEKPTIKGAYKEVEIEGTSTRGYLTYHFMLEEDLSPETLTNLDLWVSTYLVSEQSPFMQKMKAKGITRIQVLKDDDLKYPVYTIVLSDVPLNDLKIYEEKLKTALEEVRLMPPENKLEQDMIQKHLLLALEDEAETKRGLEMVQSILECWAHEKPLDTYYRMRHTLKTVETIDTASKELLLNSRQVTLVIKSKEAEGGQSDSIYTDQATNWKQVVDDMKQWQKKTDHLPLPSIKVKDLVMKEMVPYEIKSYEGYKTILTESQEALKRTTAYIPVGHIEQQDLPYLFLYTQMLKKVALEQTPVKNLIDVEMVATPKEELTPYLCISVISRDYEDVFEVLKTFEQTLRGKEEEWYQQQLKTYCLRFKEQFSSDIISTLKQLALAGQSLSHRYQFQQYYPLYQFVNQQLNTEQAFKEAFLNVVEKVEVNEGLYIGIQGTREELERQNAYYVEKFKSQPLKKAEKVEYDFNKASKLNIYYKKTPVDYVVFSYDKGEDEVEGSDYVTAAYVTNHYLRPYIRVQKGAYGSSMIAAYPHQLWLYTYRDPDLLSSLEYISQIGTILRPTLSKDYLEVAKVDALSQFQNQMKFTGASNEKATLMELLIVMGENPKELMTLQKEILRCRVKDLDEKLSLIQDVLENSQLGLCTQKQGLRYNEKANIYK